MMGQWEIYGFLKGNRKGWFTTRQLSEQLGVSSGSVASCVRRLQKTDLIAYKTVKWASKQMRSSRDIFAYRYKRPGSAGVAH